MLDIWQLRCWITFGRPGKFRPPFLPGFKDKGTCDYVGKVDVIAWCGDAMVCGEACSIELAGSELLDGPSDSAEPVGMRRENGLFLYESHVRITRSWHQG